MPLIDKLPSTGDRAIILLARGTNQSGRPGTAVPLAEGAGFRGIPVFILAECLIADIGSAAFTRTPTAFDYVTVRYRDPDLAGPAVTSNILSKGAYYTTDNVSQALSYLSQSSLTNEAKRFVAQFILPQVVVDGDYARLIRDVTGNEDLPRSAVALRETIRREASRLGVPWIDYGAVEMYGTEVGGRDNREAIERMYETSLQVWTTADRIEFGSTTTAASNTWATTSTYAIPVPPTAEEVEDYDDPGDIDDFDEDEDDE